MNMKQLVFVVLIFVALFSITTFAGEKPGSGWALDAKLERWGSALISAVP